MRHLFLFVFLLGPLAGDARAQPATDVHVPAIEIGTAFSYDIQRNGTADLTGGAGAIVAVSGNVTDHLAIATQFADSPRMRTAMAGGRVSTGFYRDGPGGPGRFFAEVLAGRHDRHGAGDGTVIQVGAGADVLVAPRGVSLHWAIDYLFTPDARTDFAGARVSVGFVVGPRRK